MSAPRPSASPPRTPTAGSPPAWKRFPARPSPSTPNVLLALAAERRCVGFVLGLPLNMDGSEGPRAQSIRAFARNLAKLTDLPIALWDERLSTAAVERELIAADVSRKKRAAVIDQHAAIFILQGALDRLAHASTKTERPACAGLSVNQLSGRYLLVAALKLPLAPRAGVVGVVARIARSSHRAVVARRRYRPAPAHRHSRLVA